jgi:hypothetical protein
MSAAEALAFDDDAEVDTDINTDINTDIDTGIDADRSAADEQRRSAGIAAGADDAQLATWIAAIVRQDGAGQRAL